MTAARNRVISVLCWRPVAGVITVVLFATDEELDHIIVGDAGTCTSQGTAA